MKNRALFNWLEYEWRISNAPHTHTHTAERASANRVRRKELM